MALLLMFLLLYPCQNRERECETQLILFIVQSHAQQKILQVKTEKFIKPILLSSQNYQAKVGEKAQEI